MIISTSTPSYIIFSCEKLYFQVHVFLLYFLRKFWHAFMTYKYLLAFMSSPEGIERLCSDMEVDHTDVRVLMLAW